MRFSLRLPPFPVPPLTGSAPGARSHAGSDGPDGLDHRPAPQQADSGPISAQRPVPPENAPSEKAPRAAPPHPALPRAETRRTVALELTIVFAITLGMSGLRSLVSIVETQIKAHQQNLSLGQLQVSVTTSQSQLGVIDLIRQLLSIAQGLAWGGLGLYLLWRAGLSLREHLGLDLRRPGRDLAASLGLAALIGIPGLALYLAAHAMGLSLTVAASTMTYTWWRAPVAILIAFQNGFLEEILVVGYLVTRLRQISLGPAAAIAISAVLRGSYHLYQGYGGFIGNIAMGIVFAYVFLRWRRIWPLVIAHGLIDTVAFVGYPLLHGHVSWLP